MFFQWQKNTSKHRIINRTPYEALLGPIKCGLSSINLPENILENVSTEEDLEKALSNIESQNNEQNIYQEAASSSDFNRYKKM